eukprot:3432350-Prymnesium_polylepis.1
MSTTTTSYATTSLSSLLRVAFTNSGANFDLELARAARSSQMRTRRANASSGQAGGEPQSWRELSRGIPADTPGYAEQAAQYRKFLSAVSAGLGGEASSAEVGEASKVAFRAIQAGRATHGESASSAGGARGPPGLAGGPSPIDRATLQRA